ncbi:MAG TPA: ABC transporter substrate-binding protein [Stellaceae bacterium]|jgi:NitT/TauT family transport system substrate-binding protein|nr:ABC transporter substrate-binding protein [Stellaceae bacterium]
MFRKTIAAAALLTVSLVLPYAPPVRAADAPKVVIALPGVPPIYLNVFAYVADKQGFFKKYGANVELRQFDSGAAGSRAVIAGDADLALVPTALTIGQIANANADVVGIYGLPNPDWSIGTTNADKAQCSDLKGAQVGVDTPGGARSLALKDMLVAGCHLTMNDVQQVPLGSNTAPAIVAGQIAYGVLHLDDVPVIESQGKKITLVMTLAKAVPVSHYDVLEARRDRLAEKRDAIVRTLAALVDAARYMADPKNADAVAQIGTVTGHDVAISKQSLQLFNGIGFWELKDDGLDKDKIEAVAEDQVKVGNVKDASKLPNYDRLVDRSVWKDANAMTGAH